jgi:hypothetical protein
MKIKFILWYTLLFCVHTNSQAQVLTQPIEEKRVLIVENFYPYSLYKYGTSLPVKLMDKKFINRFNPEDVVVEMLSSINSGDYDWNLSLWDLKSKEIMENEDKASNKDKNFWINWWKNIQKRNYYIMNKIVYKDQVFIEYGYIGTDKSLKRVSTVALKKINENWYLTREFASNPLILNWSSKTGRIQQVID